MEHQISQFIKEDIINKKCNELLLSDDYNIIFVDNDIDKKWTDRLKYIYQFKDILHFWASLNNIAVNINNTKYKHFNLIKSKDFAIFRSSSTLIGEHISNYRPKTKNIILNAISNNKILETDDTLKNESFKLISEILILLIGNTNPLLNYINGIRFSNRIDNMKIDFWIAAHATEKDINNLHKLLISYSNDNKLNIVFLKRN